MILIYKNIEFFFQTLLKLLLHNYIFKIKSDKILLKFHYITRGCELVLLSFKREMFEKLKYKCEMAFSY